MKYIQKGVEPKEFLDWKKNDKMFQRGKPNWDRVPYSIKNILRKTICIEQGYICCYCEKLLGKDDFHMDHLMPKGRNYFPEKQLDYSNLLCSCQLKLEKGEPRHCANSKGSWYQKDSFISPLDSNCETKFKYSFDGHIEPAKKNDNATITTIKKLKLCIDKLNKLREKAIEPFLDKDLTEGELKIFVNYYLADKKNNSGKFNEFYTTIKYLFGN